MLHVKIFIIHIHIHMHKKKMELVLTNFAILFLDFIYDSKLLIPFDMLYDSNINLKYVFLQ